MSIVFKSQEDLENWIDDNGDAGFGLDSTKSISDRLGYSVERPKSLREQRLVEAGKEARKTTRDAGLKALTGSPKQKAWGEKIRAQIFPHLNADAQAIVATKTSAKWWIENRDLSARGIESLFSVCR